MGGGLILLPQNLQGLRREDPKKYDFKLKGVLLLLPLKVKDIFEEQLFRD
jgi:hypothetical protein